MKELSIQMTFSEEEIAALSKKTDREIYDKNSLYAAAIEVILDAIEEPKKETAKNISDYLKDVSDTELLIFLKEMHQFRETGLLAENATARNVMEEYLCDARELEKHILSEAIERYSFLVSYLMKEAPEMFLKSNI